MLRPQIWCAVLTLPAQVEFDAGASRHVINAILSDLMEQMRTAAPVPISVSKEAWLAARADVADPGHQKARRDSDAPRMALSPLPDVLTDLPRGFVPRTAVMARSKQTVLGVKGEAPQLYESAPKLVLQGMVRQD